jgi:hypothetical protein
VGERHGGGRLLRPRGLRMRFGADVPSVPSMSSTDHGGLRMRVGADVPSVMD